MLHASGLVKSFGGFQALAGCSLEIARQSITGIIGPNGAGKSTLFNVLGGQKKLLEISRALMLEPKIILLDEPTAGVSPVMTQALGETILSLRNQGLTFAIIEHDMDVIAQLCAPIFVLAEGRTLMRGTYREVASNGEVMNAYLGKAA